MNIDHSNSYSVSSQSRAALIDSATTWPRISIRIFAQVAYEWAAALVGSEFVFASCAADAHNLEVSSDMAELEILAAFDFDANHNVYWKKHPERQRQK